MPNIFSSRPFAQTRRLLLSLGILFLACMLGLFAPFARLGRDGQEWALTSSCPICVTAAAFIGPVAAVESASKTALYMIIGGLILIIVVIVMLVDARTATLTQATVTAIAAVIISCAPLIFDKLLPENVPIHLDSGGWSVLFLGLGGFVLSCLVALALMEEERAAANEFGGGDEEENNHLTSNSTKAGSRQPEWFVASYGSIRETVPQR
jgi:hypothetical protein